MALLTDGEIKEAITRGEIAIEPFDEDMCLRAASYDFRLGKRAVITRTMSLEQLKGQIQKEDISEINVEKEQSITIPGGAFALVTTFESIRLSPNYAAHIGMRTYFIRKGLTILSGLQVDPGWEGVLVLGLANLSPRSVTLDHMDSLCTIEFHKLSRAAERPYQGSYMADQREGRIPKSDKDYLRTIETMSYSEMTRALIDVSNNVGELGKWVRGLWIGFGILIVLSILSIVLR